MSGAPRPIEEYPAAEGLPAPPAPPATAEAALAAPRKPVEVAVLDFLDADAERATVMLAHPFRWEGREVREIVVRRISALALSQALPDFQAEDDFALYAVMTDLPAPVLRAMLREDREALIAAASPLLSREMEDAPSEPTSRTGDATS